MFATNGRSAVNSRYPSACAGSISRFPRAPTAALSCSISTSNKIELCGVGGNPGDCGIHVSPKLFAPRIGLAYRPTETLVMQGGFSLNYQQDSMITNTGTYAYPEEVTVSIPRRQYLLALADHVRDRLQSFPGLNLSSGTIPALPGHRHLHRATKLRARLCHVVELHRAEVAAQELYAAGGLCGHARHSSGAAPES